MSNVFAARRKKLHATLREKKIQGYLTFDFSDVFYLSGFPSEGCFLLAGLSGDAIFSPLLLADHCKECVKGDSLTVQWKGSLWKALEETIRKGKLKRIGFDSSKLTVSLHRELSRFKGVEWIDFSGLILTQRMVKDKEEIKAIAKACHVTHQSCMDTFAALENGMTESDVAYQLENRFHEGGSPKVAFETIVAFGENAAFPHHVVTDKKLKKNTPVLMDLGCTIDGYRSDLTRTSFYGNISPRFQKIFDIVQKAHDEGVAQVREGVTAGFIDSICRDYIKKAGYGDYFIHGTGHGVGIDIHEPPRLGGTSKEVLKENMIVTVEPGIYLPGEFGVRIEDTLLVKKNGCEVLTQ